MSQNINQIFVANPAASMISTDLFYLGRSPYNTSDDFAITWANVLSSISAQLSGTVGINISGTAAVASESTINAVSTGTYYVTFVDATSGNLGLAISSSYTYNAATNTAALNISGSAASATTATSAGTITTIGATKLYGNSTGAPANGQDITLGTGLSFSGTTLNVTTAAGFTWNDVSGTTQTAAGNNGYIISNASQTTVTIPATLAEGQVIGVAGKGAGGWILQANTGQTIHFGSSATSSAGSLTSTNQWDSVQVLCVTANTTFIVISAIGNLTVA